jgi:hypothetical protein
MVNKIKTVTVVVVVIIMTALTLMLSTTTVLADSSGNNGQCIQLQKTFPPELQDLRAVMTRLPDRDIMSHRHYPNFEIQYT